MTKSLRRMPVRDPVAGILCDWFGVESGAGRVLAALYGASRPLSTAAIAHKTALAPGCVGAYCSRLRVAGLQVHAVWRKGYSLPESTRQAVREGLAHTASVLGQTIPTPGYVESLEDALGLSYDAPPEYGLTKVEGRIFGMLQKTNPISRDRIFVALYGGRSDPPTGKVIDVMICKMRPKLARHGLRVVGSAGAYELIAA